MRRLSIVRPSEGQLLQAQKMEALGQITSGIAHDLGNVLQTHHF